MQSLESLFSKEVPKYITGFSSQLCLVSSELLSYIYKKEIVVVDTSEIEGDFKIFEFKVGDILDTKIFEILNFSRVERVWEKGEYSILGDIVTVWPAYSQYPIRIDMFDRTVQQIDYITADVRTRVLSINGLMILSNIKQNTNSRVSNVGVNPLVVLYTDSLESARSTLDLNIRSLPAISHLSNTNTLEITIESYQNQGYKIYIASKSNSELEEKYNIERLDFELSQSIILISSKTIILSNRDILGTNDSTDIPFKPGEYVVHHDHGIGKYLGDYYSDGIRYLDIRYAQNDRLLVPMQSISKLDRYIGSGKVTPKVTKLNSGSWGRTISAVQQKVVGIAKELLKLYSMRQMSKSQQTISTPEQEKEFYDFCNAFKYEDTDDQKLISQTLVKDFKKDIPMDRLIVGDVGFGKTELAIRAVFAVANSGCQSAVLAPTTILASQHFKIFSERLSEYGVTVAVLSRLNSKDEKKKIINDIELGKVDVVVGTHRILQSDIKFKNLRLLVIDEEQRFGVVHKEKLKEKRLDVNVLSLSATPIPRTMSMAMSGIRDLSILASVPPGRKPILNSFNQFDWDLVVRNINEEVQRGGQIYYLHNKISDILNIKMELEIKVPGIRVSIIHGRLSKIHIAREMDQFINHQTDILLCTTIIENGLDLENVNTLIVDDASIYGLSQLYQIRGRVGRSDRQAYAHFYYNSLRGDLISRLDALNEAHDLGAGFILASRDLEIRGAGNILGKEQSGSINAVGYNLYIKMISDVVENLKKS